MNKKITIKIFLENETIINYVDVFIFKFCTTISVVYVAEPVPENFRDPESAFLSTDTSTRAVYPEHRDNISIIK